MKSGLWFPKVGTVGEGLIVKYIALASLMFGLTGCQAFLPALEFSCRHGEFGPAASLSAAKVNEELIHNLSALCAKEFEDDGI